MDPNAALENMRRLAARILRDVDAGRGPDKGDAIELAEATQALDEWLSKGGFRPTAWVV